MCNTGTPGGVSAFAVRDRKTGALQLLNYKESKGRGPSYVSVDKTGRYVLDANYGGGYRRGVFAGGGWLAGPADRVRAAPGLERASAAADQAVRALDPHRPD